MNFYKILLLMFLISEGAFSQKALRISPNRFASQKVFEAYEGDFLIYKVKGERKFRKHKISAFNDSLIFFVNDITVHINQVKWIRINKNNRVIKAFGALFVRAGILFIFLDTINNLLLERPQVVNKSAAYISLGLAASGLIIKRMGYKKIRISKSRRIKIVDLNYQNLGK